MFRASVIIALIYIAAHVTVALAQPSRDLSVLDFDSDEDDEALFESESEPVRSDLTDASSLLLPIKNQFKDIIVEIGLQVFKYMTKTLNHFKVKLLKKLGMYTLSDVFHTIFDGVTDFVVESSPSVYYEKKHTVKPVADPSPNYGYNSAYGLSTLFSRARK